MGLFDWLWRKKPQIRAASPYRLPNEEIQEAIKIVSGINDKTRCFFAELANTASEQYHQKKIRQVIEQHGFTIDGLTKTFRQFDAETVAVREYQMSKWLEISSAVSAMIDALKIIEKGAESAETLKTAQTNLNMLVRTANDNFGVLKNALERHSEFIPAEKVQAEFAKFLAGLHADFARIAELLGELSALRQAKLKMQNA